MTFRCCVVDQVLPKKVIFTLSAPSNGTCSVCANFAGTYVLDLQVGACNFYLYEGASSGCWGVIVSALVTENADGTLHFHVAFQKFDLVANYQYDGNADDFSCPVTLTCANTSAFADCTFPATATLSPGEFWPITDLKDSVCVPNSELCLVLEETGQSLGIAGNMAPAPPPFPPTCETANSSCGCDPGQKSASGAGISSQENLNRILAKDRPEIPGPVDLLIPTGSLKVALSPPRAHPLDPQPILTFNSRVTQVSDFGRGVSLNYGVSVSGDTTAYVQSASGDVLRYGGKDGSGVYLAPTGVRSKLVKNGDGTWTETQANGDVFQYTSAGKLDYVACALSRNLGR